MVNSIAFLIVLAQALLCASQQKSLTSLNHFLKVPADSIQTGGRLAERQLAYIAQNGYKSLFSIVQFATNDTSFNGVDGTFPSTDYEMSLAKGYGMEAKYVVSSMTPESAYEISNIIKGLPQPVYIHCHVGYTATLFTELHLYITGQITGDAVISNGLKYGFDYQSNPDAVALVNSVTGLSYTAQGEIFEQTLAQGEYSYKYFFWTHRLGNSDYWYNAGQILDTQPAAIKTAGYKTVISFRENGEPTNRLSTEPTTGPVDNNEFSDANGLYNATAERVAFEAISVAFVHLPVDSSDAADWTLQKFNSYKPHLRAAEAAGPVLSHCRSGMRSSAYAIAYVAQKTHQCTAWAIQEAKYVGFVFDTPGNEQIVNFFKEVLKC